MRFVGHVDLWNITTPMVLLMGTYLHFRTNAVSSEVEIPATSWHVDAH